MTSPTCVWWDTALSEWSAQGCDLEKTNQTHTVCRCSHMTHFAVLMNLKGEAVSCWLCSVSSVLFHE